MAFWADSERASGSHPSLLSAAGGHRPFTAPARPGHRPGCLRVTVNPPSALDNDAYRFWCPLLRIRDLRRDAERQHARPALSDGTLRTPGRAGRELRGTDHWLAGRVTRLFPLHG